MTLIANHEVTMHVNDPWHAVMGQLAGVLSERNAHPSRTVVLLPYAQLMQQARDAWAGHSRLQSSFFTPRFETTMNWASALPGFVYTGQDIQMDAAVDTLTAASLLQRAGLAAQQNDLTGRLVEAAWSLARVAAAQPPASRLAWGARLALELGFGME